jgi:precorrin-3B synthase
MTSAATYLPQRRGACPGLSIPMPSGDGLLARLRPSGTISLLAFAALCAAAREFGNGVIEITGRGSIQIRGLTVASAPLFADSITALAIAADDGVPVHTDALAGLDAEEILDAGSIAADLRRTLAHTSLAERLAPKASVAIDGGGALGLDNLAADIRLGADLVNGAAVFHVGVAGNAATATHLGVVASADGVKAARRLLEIIARHGRMARARDVLATHGVAPFATALADLVVAPDHSGPRRPTRVAGPIGRHLLREESFAFGVGLAFGHADAATLERLAQAANNSGTAGIRAAADRALLIVGLTVQTASTVAAEAERLGFVVRANDPRRYVVACAGAPVCAAAHIAARTLAPTVAEAARTHLDSDSLIHISGCAKGCAHPGAARLTIVGRHDGCAVISNGSVRDASVAFAAANELPSLIAEMMRDAKCEAAHV